MDSPSPTRRFVGLLRMLLHAMRNMLRLCFTLATASYAASFMFNCAMSVWLLFSDYSISNSLPPAELFVHLSVGFMLLLLPWLLAALASSLLLRLQERFHAQILPRLMADGSLRQVLELSIYGFCLVAMAALATAAGFDASDPYQDFTFANPWLADINALPGLLAETAWHFSGIGVPLTIYVWLLIWMTGNNGGGGVRRVRQPVRKKFELLALPAAWVHSGANGYAASC